MGSPVTFNSSMLIYGDKDIILINAQLIIKALNKLLEQVIKSSKNITYIYIIYAYSDYFFSSALILE